MTRKILISFLITIVVAISMILPLMACQDNTEPEVIVEEDAYTFVEGSTIFVEIGSYPQTIAKDVKIDEIKTGTYSETTGYYTYNEKQYKIIQANPYEGSTSLTFSNGEAVVKNQEYAFLVEPIVWKIINKTSSSTDGYYFVYSNNILDTCIYQYQSAYSQSTGSVKNYYLLDDDGNLLEKQELYANNWFYSNLRKCLLEFYDVAFTSVNKKAILYTTISNYSSDSGIKATAGFLYIIAKIKTIAIIAIVPAKLL